MASLASRAGELLQSTVRRLITSIAWLLADWMGWRVGTAVYPANLRNKTAIVTGANSGIGLETTKALLQQGATVIMACRNLDAGHAARQDILGEGRNHGPVPDAGGRLRVMHLDYEDLPSIRRFADDFHGLGLPLHVLVNNAGVHLMPHKHVDCGLELNIAANYWGPFYLTQLLLDDLKESAPARVVNMGSVGEVMGVRYMAKGIDWDDLRGRNLSDSGERPYALSKTHLLMGLTRELARRLEGSGVDVIAVHPGVTDSSWYKKADDDTYLFSWVISRVRSVAPWVGVGQPTGVGAISSIYASIAPELTGITSSTTSHGLIDSINRTLFGGRLVYYGPSYFFNLFFGPVNFFNAWRCIVVNPYCYNKAACKRLYEKSLELVDEVERELALPSSQAQNDSVSASGTGTTDNTPAFPTTASPDPSGLTLASAADGLKGGVVNTGQQGVVYDTAVHGALKQRQQAAVASAAPLGADE